MKKIVKYFIAPLVIIICAIVGTYYYSPGTVIKLLTGYAKWKGGIDTHSIQVDKHKWPYLEAGSKNNETIVFLHGFGSRKEFWIAMMDHFGKAYHVVAPDLPGFAENKIVDGVEYTILDQVKRLDKFLSDNDVSKFHLIGSSMGGYISLYYAIMHQEKLLSLALMNSAGVISPKQSYYEKYLIETNENLLIPEDVDGFKKFIDLVYYVPPKMSDNFAAYFAEVRKKRLKEEKLLFQGMLKSLEVPIEPMLSAIKTKTLIMWGDKDRILDVSSVQIFEKRIKNHQTVIFKDIGHIPIMEAPEKTNKAYKKFLDSL
ncbi:alpha/beta hydrolase [Patescibacteria group bacterium]|nr:alpha/beta hydrolase [Pseudomonadota bacterium]MBU1728294.1 alpha/beta hydrolase [Patescibacteria group bacterium]